MGLIVNAIAFVHATGPGFHVGSRHTNVDKVKAYTEIVAGVRH
ncbi:hypothetical protein [Actinomadura barringtoniae]|nr:hypothetical protein [Actinomadura barringtoniae]